MNIQIAFNLQGSVSDDEEEPRKFKDLDFARLKFILDRLILNLILCISGTILNQTPTSIPAS